MDDIVPIKTGKVCFMLMFLLFLFLLVMLFCCFRFYH